MRRFWVFLYTLTAALHVPFTVAVHELARRVGASRPTLISFVASILLVAAFYGRIELASHDRPIPRLRLLLLEEPYYVHWCALILTLPLWLVGAALAMSTSLFLPATMIPSSGTIALFAYLLSLLVAAYSVFVRRRWVRVRTIDISIKGLPKAFDGYRIAHLSDLHVGSLCPRERVESWVKTVGKLDVDLVALTGDYVTSGVGFHQEIAEVLGAIPSRDGTLAVMGNHDYFGDGDALAALMKKQGVEVLRNERTTIERGGEKLDVAGVDDTWSRRVNIGRALSGRTNGEPLLVLAHDPQLFPELARKGASLVLSGHTHWGQVAVPFAAERLNLSARVYRYHADLYQDGASWLYVSPGLGTTGPPVRLGSPPEITVLRLSPAV